CFGRWLLPASSVSSWPCSAAAWAQGPEETPAGLHLKPANCTGRDRPHADLSQAPRAAFDRPAADPSFVPALRAVNVAGPPSLPRGLRRPSDADHAAPHRAAFCRSPGNFSDATNLRRGPVWDPRRTAWP